VENVVIKKVARGIAKLNGPKIGFSNPANIEVDNELNPPIIKPTIKDLKAIANLLKKLNLSFKKLDILFDK